MDLRTDQMLATAFAAGDVAAFAALYDRHAPGVYAGACALLGPSDSASSVVASVFQRLARDIKKRRRVAAAPTIRLDRLTRSEVRRRLRLRGARRIRRSTDGLDRTLPTKLRASVLGLITASDRRPRPEILMRVMLGLTAVGFAAAVITGGAWLGREILDNSAASDATLAPTNPTIISPIGSTPPTSEVAALPPVPVDPATAAAGDVVTVAPVAIQLSAPSVEFGAGLADGSIVLRNVSPDVQLWNVEGDPAPFAMLASPGALEPGQEVAIAFTLDRSLLAEGTYEATVTVVGAIPQTITLRGEVNSAPQVTLLRATPQLLFACQGGTIEVAASIADDSPIGSAMVTWIGPGAPGSAAMSINGDWIGTISPELIAGNWAYAIQVVDSRGNKAAAIGSFQISAC
jgi:DNA-directed RNA polymerase specialized sigma24 family protein